MDVVSEYCNIIPLYLLNVTLTGNQNDGTRKEPLLHSQRGAFSFILRLHTITSREHISPITNVF
jgi:hypothetical protein